MYIIQYTLNREGLPSFSVWKYLCFFSAGNAPFNNNGIFSVSLVVGSMGLKSKSLSHFSIPCLSIVIQHFRITSLLKIYSYCVILKKQSVTNDSTSAVIILFVVVGEMPPIKCCHYLG